MKTIISISWLFFAVFLAFGDAEILPQVPGEAILNQASDWNIDSAYPCKETQAASSKISLYHILLENHGKFTLTRKLNIPVAGYDEFRFFFCRRTGTAKISCSLNTDKGILSAEKIIDESGWLMPHEIVVRLDGAKNISDITLNIEFLKDGLQSFFMEDYALILRDTKDYAAYERHWQKKRTTQWNGYYGHQGMLVDSDNELNFAPLVGLYFDIDDLDSMRVSLKGEINKLATTLKQSEFNHPEQIIYPRNVVNKTIREDQYVDIQKRFGSYLRFIYHAKAVAFTGLLARDTELMRLGARYAFSLAACDSWGDYQWNDLPGGGIYPAFTQSSTAVDVAFLLDCTGEIMNDNGREYVCQALYLKGVAPIDYSLFNREFAFRSNQGLAFIQGKMLALLELACRSKRIAPRVAEAKAQVDESFCFQFRADGSFMESVGYLDYTLSLANSIYVPYANAENIPLPQVIPSEINKAGLYIEAISSTSNNTAMDVIPIGQAPSAKLSPSNVVFMAAVVPNSAWTNLFYRSSVRLAYLEGEIKTPTETGIRTKKLYDLAVKGITVEPKNVIKLVDCGLLSSYRKTENGKTCKMLLVGDNIGAGKKHHDVGSFVLEYGGEIFATEIPEYSGVFTLAQYHNCLVPITSDGGFCNSIAYNEIEKGEMRNQMCPTGNGDAVKFNATVTTTPCWWKCGFLKHQRMIDSPTPREFTIVDSFTIADNAKGAAFIWITALPCSVENNKVILTGANANIATITASEECQIKITPFAPGEKIMNALSLPLDSKLNRIVISKFSDPGQSARITVKVEFSEATQ